MGAANKRSLDPGKRKLIIACLNCRKSHIKCVKLDNKEKCQYCTFKKSECNFINKSQKITVSLDYLNNLKSMIKNLETQLKNYNPDEDDGFSDADADDEGSGVLGFNDNEIFECNFQSRSGRLVESQNCLNPYFVGSSSMTLFNLEIQSLISKHLFNSNNLNSNSSTNIVTIPKKLQIINVDLKELNLPDYGYATKLIDTFISFNSGCFYFFNEGTFKKELTDFHKQKPKLKQYNGVWICKMFLILGVGEMYLYGNNIDIKLNNYKFFEQANDLFNKLFTLQNMDIIMTSNDGIETMFLYSFYLQVIDSTIKSYLCLGQALRACLLLGWHFDAQSDFLTANEIEHRRRLWWTIYMFERMFSSKAGLPLSLTDYTIAVDLPTDINETDNDYIFPKSDSIKNCVKIVQINGQILNKLYQRQPSKNILPILKIILRKLLNWRKNLPQFLQTDFHVSDSDFEISRLSTNLFTEYFNGINLTIRPILVHFMATRLKNNLKESYINLQNYSTTILSLLNSSLRASINTIRSLWHLVGHNIISLFGYMDREYIFTASCTLVLFNAAFGIHEQTVEHVEHALIILEKMTSLGSNPASLRKTQLLSLMAKLDFHGLLSELISKYNDNNITHIPEIAYGGKYKNYEIRSGKSSFFLPPTSTVNHRVMVHHVSNNKENINIKNESDDKLRLTDNIGRANSTDLLPFSNIVNESIVHSVPVNLTKSETEVMEENVNQLNPSDTIDNTDLQILLDSLNTINYDDNIMWKEISDQANWLGDTMDPTAAPGSELDLGGLYQRL